MYADYSNNGNVLLHFNAWKDATGDSNHQDQQKWKVKARVIEILESTRRRELSNHICSVLSPLPIIITIYVLGLLEGLCVEQCFS